VHACHSAQTRCDENASRLKVSGLVGEHFALGGLVDAQVDGGEGHQPGDTSGGAHEERAHAPASVYAETQKRSSAHVDVEMISKI